MRILIADDHALVRSGIRALLERLPGVDVVGEASDGEEALVLIRERRPDVLLADVAMQRLNGLDTAARVAKEFPAVRVIILSMHANEEYVMQALRAGAAGYLLKNSATAELELALQAVGRGETYLSPAISRTVIDGYLARTSGREKKGAQLTPRQREILKLVAEGRSTKEIAFALAVSVKTVETHRAELMRRLGINDIPGLVRHARRLGLLPPGE